MSPPIPLSPELAAYFVRLGKLVAAAYDDAPAAALLEGLGLELVAILTATDGDGVVRPYGFVARESPFVPQGEAGGTAPEVVIAIRGTETIAEWVSDANALQVDFPVMASPLYPKVHRGFAEIYNTLRTADGLLVKHHAALARANVVVAGHSLGGALATLLAADVGAAELVTFGGPRVGNADFCACAAKRIGRVERFVNLRDPVPKVPLNLPHFQYAELGVPLAFDSEGAVKDNPHAAHSLATYLHFIDPTQPIDPEWLPT